MTVISEAEYNAALEADLAEAFELFIQQSAYYEVLNVTSGIIAHLDRFPIGHYHNASGYFEHDGEKYAYDRDAALIETTYYRFDTMREAIAFATELLATVEEGV